ncbi:MAG: ATP-binding protein [Candidatus Peregrinibacteria bacterium]
MFSIFFKIRFYSWYFFALIIIVAAIGGFSTAYTYSKVTTLTQKSLLEHVSTVATAIEYDLILSLKGSEEDLANPDYIVLKQKLTKIRELSDNVRFVYLAGFREGNPFFFVDSEPADSPDYSPPGQVYPEATPAFRNSFFSKESIIEDISSDRWGTWLTSLTPIINSENGQIIAVMGMDIDASSYFQTAYTYAALPATITCFIVLLITFVFLLWRRERKFLEFKSELVAIASHEIRTPLIGVTWLTDVLLQEDRNSLTLSQKDSILLIQESGKNLLMTVNSLLDLFATEKMTDGKIVKESVAIVDLLQEIAVDFKLAAREKEITLIFDIPVSSNISITGDRDKIKRMFNNLISNAIKYSKRHSEIILGCKPCGKKIVFWIRDHGIGIPEKDQQRVFKGFYRSKNAKQFVADGTGLGLRYVKQTVELHSGRVWLESKENVGSTFFVELPTS